MMHEKMEECTMRKIQKWGNSLAVRIPAKWARKLMLQEGMTIEMCMENNAIIIRNSDDQEPAVIIPVSKKELAR
jgi:antitoxin component of MazEF toxin-antitoxin module